MADTNQKPIKPSQVADNENNSVAGDASDQALLLTFGLKDQLEWLPALHWFNQNDLLDILALILDGILFGKHPIQSLAYVFRFVTRPSLRPQLKEWAAYDETAHDLHRLSHAIANDPEVFSLFKGVADERNADSQLHRKLSVNYLLGMLINRPNNVGDEEEEYLTIFQAWVLLKALDQTKRGFVQERHIREVAMRLRHAFDNDSFYRDIFLYILPDFQDLDLFGDSVYQKADTLLVLRKKQATFSDSERRLINALKHIGMGEEHPEALPQGIQAPGLYAKMAELHGIPSLPTINDPFLRTEPDSEESFDIPGDSGSQDTKGIKTKAKQSYVEQTQHVRSILMADVQTQQFLPYSWNSITPQEHEYLKQWIEETLSSVDHYQRLLAVFVWIAIHIGQSLYHTQRTKIATHAGENWTLDPQALRLIRQPPMRTPGWEAKGASTNWVTPISQHIEISLPDAVKAALMTAMQRVPGAKSLLDLWLPLGKKADKVFRELTGKGPLARVQPGMLGNVFPQELFWNSEDAAFARLLANRNSIGMPGNCAYPSWVIPEDQPSIAHLTIGSAPSDIARIGLGSRLDPIEKLLTDTITTAKRKLDDIQETGNLLSYHNALTCYLTTAILAATGARPINDLIESPQQIDFREAFVFVEDKATGSASDGRLVPMPKALNDYLDQDYLKYLSGLADGLEKHAPEMATEIRQLSKRKPSNKIPFLFLLTTEQSCLSWRSVTETRLEDMQLFPWALPWNLFRHRLANQLRYLSVHPEIIDGLFGHVEGTTATWGSYSPRCWKDDMRAARPVIEAAFNNLQFQLPDLSTKLPALRINWVEEVVSRGTFGRVARKTYRKERKVSVKKATEAEIELYVQKAHKEKLTELDEEQIEELSRRLFFSPKKIPRADGFFRYAIFIDKLETAWKEKGEKVKIKHRYARLYAEKSRFTPFAPNATHRLAQFQKAVQTGLGRKSVEKIPAYQTAPLGALLLATENLIADATLLTDVLYQRNYRLVSYNSQVYFEYAPALEKRNPDAAVQRYRISTLTARVLNRALSSNRKWKKKTPLPSYLQPVLSLLDNWDIKPYKATMVGIIKAVRPLVQQTNMQTLPGIVAAYLNGHINSISPSWRDWVRMSTGKQMDFPESLASVESTDETSSERDLQTPDDLQPVYSTQSWKSENPEYLQCSARAFMKAITDVLPTDENAGQYNTYDGREKLARTLIDTMHQHVNGVSSSIVLLGRWVVKLLFRQVRDSGRWHYILFSTIRNYLSVFGRLFEQLAYQVDLIDADEEDVTALYVNFLKEKPKDSKKYAFGRLLDFHNFARDEDVVDPDWSELPKIAKRFSVSPGILLEREYLDTLVVLLQQPGVDADFRYAQGFILFCAYRFGLRGNEAIGMRQSDWRDIVEPWEILVQPNKVRRLKTGASRRHVPLLFKLDKREKEILQHVLADPQLRYDWESSRYLLDAVLRANEWRLKGGINKALKRVTGNPRMVLHHARHTAGNTVAAALFRPNLPKWWAATTGTNKQQSAIYQHLLRTPSITRRASWATAIYMGHAGPKSTFQSYVHLVGEWANQLINREPGKLQSSMNHVIVLEDYPEKAPVDIQLLKSFTSPLDPITPSKVLHVMRYLTLGKSCAHAASLLSIDPVFCSELDGLMCSLDKKVRIKTRQNTPDKTQEPLDFLRRISIDGWNRLILLCEKAEKQETYPGAQISIRSLYEVIGATRQILLWRKSHFSSFRSFLDYYQLDKAPFLLVHSDSPKNDGTNKTVIKLLDKAEKFGFTPIPARSTQLKESRNRRGVEIDRIQRGDSDNYKVLKRCAAILTRNRKSTVHGSYEWITLFIAWVSATEFRGKTSSSDSQ